MNARPLMRLRLTTGATDEIGQTPHGRLSIFPITGGSFEGERLRGTVLAGGGDWVTAVADGTFELDLRVTLETDDGALIHMTFTGGGTTRITTSARCPASRPPRRSMRSSIACSPWALARFTPTGRFTPSRRFSERRDGRPKVRDLRAAADSRRRLNTFALMLRPLSRSRSRRRRP